MRLSASLFGLCLLLAGRPVPAAQNFGDWSAPVNLGPGINSTANDEGPALSSDGLSLYFTSNRSGNQDLWVAQREDEDDPWGVPVNLGAPVNTPFIEQAPAFSRDGRRMFFVSNRPGSQGGLDLWVSVREDEDDDFAWQAPINLGVPINSVVNDAGPGLLRVAGDEFLFITTNRPGGSGGPDIWMSVGAGDGSFGAPAPVQELNSAVQDARPTLRRDGREVVFFSTRAGSLGLTDLWASVREDREDPWSAPTNLGSVVNSAFDDTQPAFSQNGRTLLFASNRPGGSGQLDLYMITRKRAE